MSLCDRKKRPFRRGRCPQRPAIPDAPTERADEDIGPYGRPLSVHQKKTAPRDCCPARRASKQGMSQAYTNHRRAAAGGERSTTTSLHPRRSIFLQASLPNGSPGSGASAPVIFGYFPSLESSSPAGETSPPRPQAEHPTSPSKTKKNARLRINGPHKYTYIHNKPPTIFIFVKYYGNKRGESG